VEFALNQETLFLWAAAAGDYQAQLSCISENLWPRRQCIRWEPAASPSSIQPTEEQIKKLPQVASEPAKY
jgi:hypothetical protein